MPHHKLHLEDLDVESFSTTSAVHNRGTVNGHVGDPGTIGSWCNTCDGFTCVQDTTCAPEHTCVMNTTCAPEYTCEDGCDGASGLC
jgi:hypothetical protein